MGKVTTVDMKAHTSNDYKNLTINYEWNTEVSYGGQFLDTVPLYKTLDEFIKEAYGTVKLKRGRWYIIQEDECGHGLWHQCAKGIQDLDFATYVTYSSYKDMPVKPSWKCSCNAIPPDSIVAVWCLLEPENTSEQVQEALAYDHEYDHEYDLDSDFAFDADEMYDFIQPMWRVLSTDKTNE
jgi:hypothetical protein